MEIKSINDRWKEFAEKVIPAGAPKVQHDEMKKAFFAGWSSALFCLRNEISEIPEGEGVKRLERFYKEAEGFVVAVKMGGLQG